MLKYKKIPISCGVLILNAQLLYQFRKRKKSSHARNVHSRSVPNVNAKLIQAKAVTHSFRTKLNLGKIQPVSRGVRNAAQSCKKYQDAITCHVQYVGINGVGCVGLTIVTDILIH